MLNEQTCPLHMFNLMSTAIMLWSKTSDVTLQLHVTAWPPAIRLACVSVITQDVTSVSQRWGSIWYHKHTHTCTNCVTI